MAKFLIEAMYEYCGEVEADTPEEAEKLFLDDLDLHYQGTYSYTCDELEEDESENE